MRGEPRRTNGAPRQARGRPAMVRANHQGGATMAQGFRRGGDRGDRRLDRPRPGDRRGDRRPRRQGGGGQLRLQRQEAEETCDLVEAAGREGRARSRATSATTPTAARSPPRPSPSAASTPCSTTPARPSSPPTPTWTRSRAEDFLRHLRGQCGRRLPDGPRRPRPARGRPSSRARWSTPPRSPASSASAPRCPTPPRRAR